MTTTELALPQTAEPATWTRQQTRIMAFAGLAIIQQNGNVIVPNPGVAEAFIAICNRTGLDPIAKQIYAMEVGGKYIIVTGVDGFRVIAQRTGEYQGQIGPQWTDGKLYPVLNAKGVEVGQDFRWLDAWISTENPAAARIGILRRGWKEPLWQTVTAKEFAKNTGQWPKMFAHMLGIRAETHGMRRAFPNDLSGLYTVDDFDAGELAVIDGDDTKIATIESITTEEELRRQFKEWQATSRISDRVQAVAMARAAELAPDEAPAGAGEEIAEPVDENPPEEPEAADRRTAAQRVTITTAEEQPEPESAVEEEDELVKTARKVMPPEEFEAWRAERQNGGQA